MTTTVAEVEPVTVDGDDDSIIHIVCFAKPGEPAGEEGLRHIAFCGKDISGEVRYPPGDYGHRDCVVCVDLTPLHDGCTEKTGCVVA